MIEPTAKAQATKLRKLLKSTDEATIRQGFELAMQLDDPAVYFELVDGATFLTDAALPGVSYLKAIGRVVPNKAFTGANKRQNLLDYVFAQLLAASDHPVKKQVTALRLGSWDHKQPEVAMEYGWLRGFPNLQHLQLRATSGQHLFGLEEAPITELTVERYGRAVILSGHPTLRGISGPILLEAGGSWPELRSATITGGSALAELATAAPQLENLTASGAGERIVGHPSLERVTVDELGVIDCPQVSHATFRKGPVDISGTPRLRYLSVGDSITDRCDLSLLTSVEELSLERSVAAPHLTVPPNAKLVTTNYHGAAVNLGSVEDLGNISNLGGLTHLSIHTNVDLSLEPLRNASELQQLTIRTKGSIDLGPLADMTELRMLRLATNESVDLAPLAQLPSLRVVDVRSCRGISDLTPLIDTPMLQVVAVRDSGVASEPPELRDIVSRSSHKDFAKELEAAKPKPRLAATEKRTDIPVPEAQRDQWNVVIHGLDSRSWMAGRPMAEAVDLAISLGDPAIDFLLSKVKIVQHRIRMATPFNVEDPGDRPDVVATLLAAASEDSEPAKKLRALKVLVAPGKRDNAYSFDKVDEFRSLETLVIKKGRDVALGGIANLSQLHTLVVSAQRANLPELPKSLRRLMIHRARRTENLWPLVSESNIEELALMDTSLWDAQLSDAGPMPVRSLTAEPRVVDNVLHHADWPHLKEVELYLHSQPITGVPDATLTPPLRIPVEQLWISSFDPVPDDVDPDIRALMKVRAPLHPKSWDPAK